jgi:hypothetical protein
VNAEESPQAAAVRLCERVVAKHGGRAPVVLCIISGVGSHVARLGVTASEFASVIQELQTTLDEWNAFKNKN